MLASDIRVASDQARFGLPEVKHALIPFAGALVRLIQRALRRRAPVFAGYGESCLRLAWLRQASTPLAFDALNRRCGTKGGDDDMPLSLVEGFGDVNETECTRLSRGRCSGGRFHMKVVEYCPGACDVFLYSRHCWDVAFLVFWKATLFPQE